ncbi:hypothetical protein V6N13_014037 [Hibiscus sabdariffa]
MSPKSKTLQKEGYLSNVGKGWYGGKSPGLEPLNARIGLLSLNPDFSASISFSTLITQLLPPPPLHILIPRKASSSPHLHKESSASHAHPNSLFAGDRIAPGPRPPRSNAESSAGDGRKSDRTSGTWQRRWSSFIAFMFVSNASSLKHL